MYVHTDMNSALVRYLNPSIHTYLQTPNLTGGRCKLAVDGWYGMLIKLRVCDRRDFGVGGELRGLLVGIDNQAAGSELRVVPR